MPENEYCLDNFFHKMTDLESPKKNNDCYFYYYSTCTKGDRCMFRHEPSALGCETMCSFWKEGKCINIHCNFRHMELRKNRKSIPCYWESQPGGCKKPHCPFLHLSPKSDSDNGETSNIKSNSDLKEADLRGGLKQSRNDDFGPAVDPLVVNFEEESDNESAPSQSPVKTQQQPPQQQRVVKVKTLEEIKLERIQAESAAYYSYEADETIEEDDQPMYEDVNEADYLRSRIINRLTTKQDKPKPDVKNIEILSLDEIRKRKRSHDPEPATPKKPKVSLPIRKAADISEIKIKTLAEIKAERAQRFGLENKRKLSADDDETGVKRGKFIEESDSEVSSTSEETNKAAVEEEMQKRPVIKLRRAKSPIVFDKAESGSTQKVIKLKKNDENIDSSGSQGRKIDSSELDQSKHETIKSEIEQESENNVKTAQDENKLIEPETTLISNIHEERKLRIFARTNNPAANEEVEAKMSNQNTQSSTTDEVKLKETKTDDNFSEDNIETEAKAEVSDAPKTIQKQMPHEKSLCDDTDTSISDKLELDSSKYEQFLLEEDDEDATMTLRTDDDILEDIDSLLDD